MTEFDLMSIPLPTEQYIQETKPRFIHINKDRNPLTLCGLAITKFFDNKTHPHNEIRMISTCPECLARLGSYESS